MLSFLQAMEPKLIKLPKYGWMGLSLIGVCWFLNWTLDGLRTHLLFFPLWFGYCLFVDALVFMRKKSSLISRNRFAYVGLFLISAPAWWLFEVINWRTQNWFYVGRQYFSDFEYIIFATINFSTVIPAVFGTAELMGSFEWLKKNYGGPKITTSPKTLFILFIFGCLMLFSLFLYPKYFFPFVWIALYFIVDSINVRLKRRSLIQYTEKRDWRPVLSLWLGCLVCGFFWEMWNFYSYPKWIYKVPFVDFWHIFEMPILGYLGYLPFSLELFAIYHLTIKFIKFENAEQYVQI